MSNGQWLDVEVKLDSVSDQNNKRQRPNSPCEITHGSSFLIPVPTYGSGGASWPLNVPARQFCAGQKLLFADDMSRFNNSAIRKITAEKDKLIASFSSLNFAYELRETTNPIKDFMDRRFRYISWAFGIAPLIADMKSALEEVDSRIVSFNKKMERFAKPIPLNWGYSKMRSIDRSATYFSGNDHTELLDARCKMRVKGHIGMTVPYLARVSPPVFDFLDTLAVDLSVGVLWEALPFSWLVDWFFPVGLAFENMASAMRPEVYFSGNLHYKINSVARLKTRHSGPSYAYPDGVDAGVSRAQIYIREPFNGPVSGLVEWDIVPKFDLHRAGILRDLVYRSPGKTIWHRL